jgi:hypothetical protein
MFFDEIIGDLENKKDRREKGLFNGIPTPFNRYRDYFPSIDKGASIGILGATGIGKSKFVRELAVYKTFQFHLETGYPLKILYFALEDAKPLVYKKMMIRYIWERHNVLLPARYLDSKVDPLSSTHLSLIKEDREFYRKLEDTVFIVNDATTPSSIRDASHRFHDKFGKDNHLIVVIDNYSNITKEKHHGTDWDAIRELSRQIVRLDLCKQKQMTVFSILQQDFEQERHTFRNAGKGSISSLEPNLASIGDAKVVARDQHYVFALFHPWRYEIREYMGTSSAEGYNIDFLRNRFRSLIMLKSNEEEVAPRLGLYFDGLKESYTEMPMISDRDSLQRMYTQIEKEEKEKREKFAKRNLF